MSNEHAEHADVIHSGPHDPKHYVRIWAILLGCLIVSLVGPVFGIIWLTLITAFGIAIVKAYLVAVNFMHINIERKWVTYLLFTMLLFVGLFMGGVSPDVMKHEGQNWRNVAAQAVVQEGLKEGFGRHNRGESVPPHTKETHPAAGETVPEGKGE